MVPKGSNPTNGPQVVISYPVENTSHLPPVLLTYLKKDGSICAGNLFTGKTLPAASLALLLHLTVQTEKKKGVCPLDIQPRLSALGSLLTFGMRVHITVQALPFHTTTFSSFSEKTASSCFTDTFWQQRAQASPALHPDTHSNFQTYSCEDPGCPV